MTDRLFPLDDVPEVPLLREPRRHRGAQVMDARLDNDYPPEWSKCATCGGRGKLPGAVVGYVGETPEFPPFYPETCPDCKGMGSVKARVRLEAGHRCVRCQHPFMTKGDARMLGVEPSPGRWSPCDERCTHAGPIRWTTAVKPDDWLVVVESYETPGWPAGSMVQTTLAAVRAHGGSVEAEWRVLTVHHLDGDKSNLRWWNLVALDQRCHLEIQARVVMDRVYPHEHSEWFKPYVAGYYAFVYLCKICGRDMSRPGVAVPGGPSPRGLRLERLASLRGVHGFPHTCVPGLEITREEAAEHMDFLLGLELVAV